MLIFKLKRCAIQYVFLPTASLEATLALRTPEKIFLSPHTEHAQPTFKSHPSPHNGMALYNFSRSLMFYQRPHLHPEPQMPHRLPESQQRYPDVPEATPAIRIVGHSS